MGWGGGEGLIGVFGSIGWFVWIEGCDAINLYGLVFGNPRWEFVYSISHDVMNGMNNRYFL